MILALEDYQWLYAMGEMFKIFFVFALGACVGSLTNVLVYRLPLGISVVTPPSRCPKCSTRLKWKDNIPIFGWIFLRGRCRYCGVKISPEYPLVETFVAFLFAVTYVICYLPEDPLFSDASILGVPLASLQPDWAQPGFIHSWPIFIVLLTLLGCLVAMTLVDAKTFTIPLVLTWVPAIVALVALPGLAAMVQFKHWRLGLSGDWSFVIPSPGPRGWKWFGISCGGVLGLAASLLLLRLGLLKRSFADLDEPAASPEPVSLPPGPTAPDVPDPGAALLDAATGTPPPIQPPPADAPPLPRSRRRSWAIWGIIAACATIGAFLAPLQGFVPLGGLLAGAVSGPLVAGVVLRLVGWGPEPLTPDESPADEWLAYPHARREVIREVAYLAPCLLFAAVGAAVAMSVAGPWRSVEAFERIPRIPVPLWLDALSGVFLGYLVGGGVVWAIRILGSLLFGKEAMGLGDVHMMAGVGACLGWIDPTLAFFLAAFVGVYRELASRLLHGAASRAMPFGPSLAIATAIVIFAKPWIESGINGWVGATAEQRIELP